MAPVVCTSHPGNDPSSCWCVRKRVLHFSAYETAQLYYRKGGYCKEKVGVLGKEHLASVGPPVHGWPLPHVPGCFAGEDVAP